MDITWELSCGKVSIQMVDLPGRSVLFDQVSARHLFNWLGEILVKRAPDVDAQLQEERDVALRAHGLAMARVEVLAAELSARTKELLGCQEAHGRERRSVESLRASLELASAAACKWYNFDGTSIDLHPDEVVKMRKQAAGDMQEMATALAKLQAENATLRTQVAAAYDQGESALLGHAARDLDILRRALNTVHEVVHKANDEQARNPLPGMPT